MNFCPGELFLKLLARIGEWHQNLSEKTGDSTPPPVNRITDACENITLPQLRCGRQELHEIAKILGRMGGGAPLDPPLIGLRIKITLIFWESNYLYCGICCALGHGLQLKQI